MSIIQTNTWTCEICGKVSVDTHEVWLYSDPVVKPPNDENWYHVGEFFKEKLACPKCVKKYGNQEEQ